MTPTRLVACVLTLIALPLSARRFIPYDTGTMCTCTMSSTKIKKSAEGPVGPLSASL